MIARAEPASVANLDFTGLLYSLAVAEHLGFRKAAEALGVQESAVSRRVRALEDRLHVSLFERTSHGARLTIAGERFLSHARSALTEIDYAAASAHAVGRGEEGRLRIGFFTALSSGFLRELVRRYRTAHPQMTIELHEGSSRHHVTLVRERRLDVTFVMGVRKAADCEVSTLWNEPVYVALPQGHRLADQAEVAWADLENERFIASQSECGAEVHDHVVRHMAGLGHSPEVDRIAVARDTLLNLVELGFGVTLVTDAGVTRADQAVLFRPLADPVDVVSFSAVWSQENDNPALRQFISLAHVLAGKVRRGTSDWTGYAA